MKNAEQILGLLFLIYCRKKCKESQCWKRRYNWKFLPRGSLYCQEAKKHPDQFTDKNNTLWHRPRYSPFLAIVFPQSAQTYPQIPSYLHFPRWAKATEPHGLGRWNPFDIPMLFDMAFDILTPSQPVNICGREPCLNWLPCRFKNCVLIDQLISFQRNGAFCHMKDEG